MARFLGACGGLRPRKYFKDANAIPPSLSRYPETTLPIKVVFPTLDEVNRSFLGQGGGGTIICSKPLLYALTFSRPSHSRLADHPCVVQRSGSSVFLQERQQESKNAPTCQSSFLALPLLGSDALTTSRKRFSLFTRRIRQTSTKQHYISDRTISAEPLGVFSRTRIKDRRCRSTITSSA